MTEESKVIQQYFDVRTTNPGHAKLYLRQAPDLDTSIERPTGPEQGPGISLRRSRDFTFRIIASDNGTPRRHTAEASVTVRVLDVNDMAPKISVNYLTPPSQKSMGGMLFSGPGMQRVYGELEENVGQGLIAFVTVLDLDSGPWGQVTCRTDNDAFKLVPTGGVGVENGMYVRSSENEEPTLANEEISFKLMAQKPFDREMVQQVGLSWPHLPYFPTTRGINCPFRCENCFSLFRWNDFLCKVGWWWSIKTGNGFCRFAV